MNCSWRLLFVAGVVFTLVMELLVLFALMLYQSRSWEHRGGITYRKRPSDP